MGSLLQLEMPFILVQNHFSGLTQNHRCLALSLLKHCTAMQQNPKKQQVKNGAKGKKALVTTQRYIKGKLSIRCRPLSHSSKLGRRSWKRFASITQNLKGPPEEGREFPPAEHTHDWFQSSSEGHLLWRVTGEVKGGCL